MSAWGKSVLFVAEGVSVRDFRCWGEKRPFLKEEAGGCEPPANQDARDVEIELPRRGAHLRAHGRQTFVVNATTAAIVPAPEGYLRASPSSAPQSSTLLTLSGELGERLARAKTRVLSLSRASASAHEKLLASAGPLELHERAIALVEAIAADSGASASDPANHPAAAWKRVAVEIQYVLATRYADKLTLDEVARAARVSPFHAARIFRAVTGRSIHEQLVRVRIHHALYELAGGAGALTEVGLRAGFSSHSHFTSTFRRVMGVTPSQLAAKPGALRAWRTFERAITRGDRA